MFRAFIAFNVLIWLFLAYNKSSDKTQHAEQEVILNRATQDVGMPDIRNFEERRLLRGILEARDQSVHTTSYTIDESGHLHKICDSVGYGIPASTQYTNPAQYWSSGVSLPQADPNALFSSSMTPGIWLDCTNPVSKTQDIVFVQPHVIVSPFPLETN